MQLSALLCQYTSHLQKPLMSSSALRLPGFFHSFSSRPQHPLIAQRSASQLVDSASSPALESVHLMLPAQDAAAQQVRDRGKGAPCQAVSCMASLGRPLTADEVLLHPLAECHQCQQTCASRAGPNGNKPPGPPRENPVPSAKARTLVQHKTATPTSACVRLG